MDDHRPLVVADDACPICNTSMMDRGQYAGVWDGALGPGHGSWITAVCHNCHTPLIGWQYWTDSTAEQKPTSRIRWKARHSRSE